MNKIFQYIGQLIIYSLFALMLGYFSNSPVYTHLSPDNAVIRLSFNHAANLREACRKLSYEEMAKLPPNMRIPTDCPRERLPVRLEMVLDEKLVYSESLEPSGLWKDGEAVVNRKFIVPSGRHHLVVRMTDSHRDKGFDYEKEEWLELKPYQNTVISFIREQHSFIFR